jgi:hypothetical protein
LDKNFVAGEPLLLKLCDREERLTGNKVFVQTPEIHREGRKELK